MNDAVHADDVTHDHFGFLIEIDAILREKGCNEVSTSTPPPYEPSVGLGKSLATATVAFK